MLINSNLGKLRLDGKVAIVTGAAGILGQCFCGGFAEAGASVAAVDISRGEVERLAEELREKYGVEAIGLGCDVSDPISVQSMVGEVARRFGSVHILHNNAATKGTDFKAFFEPFESYSLKTWREVMAVNIDGMFLVAQAVGKKMLSQGMGGTVIQTASIYGVVAPDPRIYEGSHYLGHTINTPAVYSASKAAVIGLTRYLATYWAPYGIRVNCLVPGGVESGQNDQFVHRYSERVPLRRMAHRDEMVGATIFLASEAASYVTGQVLAVDGGLTAW